MAEQFPRSILRQWATLQPEILALYVFGSRARGTATSTSDLDLAFELDDGIGSELSALIVNAARWKAELARLTGLFVKDLYLRCDDVVEDPVVEVYRR